MSGNDEDRFNRQIDRVETRLPDRVGRFLRWLRKPSSRWVRVPLGLALIAAGILSFLPILGIWMLPLGLLLLAQDIPLLRRPVLAALDWIERRWVRWKSRRRDRR